MSDDDSGLKIGVWDKLGLIKTDHDELCDMDLVCTKVIGLAIHFKHLGCGRVESIQIKSTADPDWLARIEPLPTDRGYLAEWVYSPVDPSK
jgi:hypothetical protein